MVMTDEQRFEVLRLVGERKVERINQRTAQYDIVVSNGLRSDGARRVTRQVKELLAAGLIEYGQKTGRNTHDYRLTIPAGLDELKRLAKQFGVALPGEEN